MMSNILDLIREVGEKEQADKRIVVFLKEVQREFVISESGLLKKFKFRPIRKEGFYLIHVNEGKLINKRQIDPDDALVYDYLSLLTRVHMIAARSVDDYNWMALPVNEEVAQKQGLLGCQIVFGCENIEHFDHIICGQTLDGHLVFIENDYSFDPQILTRYREQFEQAKQSRVLKLELNASQQHQEVFKLAIQEVKELIEEDRKILRQTIEGRIRLSLEETGARLISHVVRRDLVEVRWRSRSGQAYSSILNSTTLDVIAAGICLSGTDRVFDLVSLVGVIHEGERSGLIVTTR